MSWWNIPQPEVVLGGIPLLRSSHFRNRGLSSWNAPQDLERLQRLLYEQTKAKEQNDSDEDDEDEENEEEEKSIVLVSKYKPYSYRKWTWNNKIPYHEDILPRWQAFGNAQKNREGLELLKIDNIVLPPSPYFSDKFMPLLINNDDTLTSLQLSNTDLGSEEIKCIAKFIKKNKTLSTLDISGNKMDNVAAAKSLALAMKKHPEIDFVNLSKCNLGGKIFVPRQEGIPSHEVEGSVDVLAALLTGCKKLETLLLDNNGISSERGVSLVAKFLANNKALTTISLEGNELQGKVFDQAITKNTELRQLNLGRNKIAVPTFLKDGNINLTCIDLGRNSHSRGSMGIAGAKIIAKYLKGNPAVTELNLASNRLPPKAADVLASALKRNTVLQHLNLAGNNFNDNSVPSFVACLKKNSTLLTLDLCYNSIRIKTGRKELLRGAFCDTSNLQSIATSNHTCALTMVDGTFKNDITKEVEMRNINLLDSEGMKIRYKVVLALFSMNKDLFHPRSFDEVPLELMPRLLELVQCEVGYGGFGAGITKVTRKKRANGFNPTLRRLYQVVTEWNTPELVSRGPGKGSLTSTGKLKTKRDKTKRVLKVADEDEDWTPNGAPKKKKRRNRWRAAPSQQSSSSGAGSTTGNSRSKRSTRNTVSYADVENSEDES